jgi:hypothetical protein
VARSILGEKCFDGRSFRKIGKILGLADNFLQPPEKEHSDARIL